MLAALYLSVALFLQAGSAPSSDPKAWVMLAEKYAAEKNENEARAAAARAEELGGKDAAVLQRLANFYAGILPDLPKAAELGWRYAERAPEDATAWRRVAALYLALNKPDRAIEAGLRGVQADDTPEMHRILGRAYAARRDWAQAGAELAKVVQANPYSEQAHFELAQMYLVAQDFPSAVRALESARKTFDKSPQIELALGVAYYGLRRFPEAVDQFLKTIALAPDVRQPYVFLGKMLEHTGDRLPEVTARFAEFERQSPDDSLGYVLHAKALVAQLPPAGESEDAQLAEKLVAKALAIKEQDADAQYLAGVLDFRKGQFETAAGHLERSVAVNSNEAAPHYYLARAYDRLGRRDEAAKQRDLHQTLSERDKATLSGAAPSVPPAAVAPRAN